MTEFYIEELIKALKRKLNKYTLGTYFNYDEDKEILYIKIYSNGETVYEETIPISKLVLDNINDDKEYIFNNYIMKSSYLNHYITEHDDPNSHLNHLIQWTDDYLNMVNGYYNENYERRDKLMKLHIKEGYKDSDAYKKLADYDYICDVKGNKVIIKWADDGHTYAEFTLYSPEEMFTDTDIDPYDDFGKSHGFDCWVIYNGDEYIDTYAKTYDDAVVSAIKYFWTYY